MRSDIQPSKLHSFKASTKTMSSLHRLPHNLGSTLGLRQMLFSTPHQKYVKLKSLSFSGELVISPYQISAQTTTTKAGFSVLSPGSLWRRVESLARGLKVHVSLKMSNRLGVGNGRVKNGNWISVRRSGSRKEL